MSSERPPARITAIVLHYAREEETRRAVEALERSRAANLRILIVDNASPDGSGERLRAHFPAHGFLQTGENLGYAGGNALGIARALEEGAEYLLVINDDAEVDERTVSTLAAALDADERAAAAAPTIRYDDAQGSVCWAGGEFDTMRAVGRPSLAEPRDLRVQPCSFVSGCCVMLRGSAIRELGSFRAEYFSYVEDAELSLRSTRAGWRLLFVPAARVVHHTPYPEPPPAPWKVRLRDLNRRRLVAEHYGVLERVRFALWFYPTRVLLMAGALLRGDRARAAALWRGMTGALSEPSRP